MKRGRAAVCLALAVCVAQAAPVAAQPVLTAADFAALPLTKISTPEDAQRLLGPAKPAPQEDGTWDFPDAKGETWLAFKPGSQFTVRSCGNVPALMGDAIASLCSVMTEKDNQAPPDMKNLLRSGTVVGEDLPDAEGIAANTAISDGNLLLTRDFGTVGVMISRSAKTAFSAQSGFITIRWK